MSRKTIEHPGKALALSMPETDIAAIEKIDSRVRRVASIRSRICCSLRDAMNVENYIMERK